MTVTNRDTVINISVYLNSNYYHQMQLLMIREKVGYQRATGKITMSINSLSYN